MGAALHNLGMAQLRAQSYEDAVTSFEEAARVRKGSLGRDHPLVAITLVKVSPSGILLLSFIRCLTVDVTKGWGQSPLAASL